MIKLTSRQELYYRYLQSRKTGITAIALGKIFDRSPEAISIALRPLVQQGLVVREKRIRRRTEAVREGYAYFYRAVDSLYKQSAKRPRFVYHNPFGIRGCNE